MAAAKIPKIAIVSIGDMGMGIAKLLVANGFHVATNCRGRSNDTLDRAKSAQVELIDSDEGLVEACDVLLSVLPPRDAVATAQRIVDALDGPLRPRPESRSPLYYADLNAVAPSTVKSIAALFDTKSKRGSPVRFVDGGIIGGPPAVKVSSAEAKEPTGEWSVPSIPMSGPHKLSDIPVYGAKLSKTLNVRHISDDIGAASGLKLCFASLTKGFTSLAIQSFTTAKRLGVLGELQGECESRLPHQWKSASSGVVGMAPKAYRWVREMEEIALTFAEEGGFPQDSYLGAAKVYKAVAEDTVLGLEKVGKRKRGLDVDDMAAAMAEGMENKKKKNE